MIPAYTRIMQKVEVDDNGCWIFMGATFPNGYGKISMGRKGNRRLTASCHRIMYISVYGYIPDKLVVRHRCAVKRFGPGMKGKNTNQGDFHEK